MCIISTNRLVLAHVSWWNQGTTVSLWDLGQCHFIEYLGVCLLLQHCLDLVSDALRHLWYFSEVWCEHGSSSGSSQHVHKLTGILITSCQISLLNALLTCLRSWSYSQHNDVKCHTLVLRLVSLGLSRVFGSCALLIVMLSIITLTGVRVSLSLNDISDCWSVLFD